jgi:signal transduction histidine kinase
MNALAGFVAALRSRWPKRWRLYSVIALFPLLSFWGVYALFKPSGPAWPSQEPAEGFYWSAAQYQLALGEVHEQLLSVVATANAHDLHDPVAPSTLEELRVRTDVLLSRASLLREPSEIQERLRSLPDYDAVMDVFTRFDEALSDSVQRANFTPADAKAALGAFASVEPVVQRFVNLARQREIDGRSQLYESFQKREHDRLLGALAIWAIMVGWVFWILATQQRDRRLAKDRLVALQGEQEAREQLREEMNMKATFLSMVSHELRSPLQVVVSSVDVLGMDVSNSERQSAIARIRRAALMMGVQLRDLLTIARGEAGRLEIQPESFEATSLVEDVAAVAAHAARERGLAFEVNVPEEPVFVRADVQRISQVLGNLVSNAVRNTKEGRVSMTLTVPGSGDRLLFTIEDTGPGLPEEPVRRLREPVDRNAPLTVRQDGSGVGLTVVRTVVDHLGGSVDVQTSQGSGHGTHHGTRFEVSIPVIFEDPQEVPSEGSPDGLVLVVDDEADISASVAALVKGYGHPCHIASTAEEAHRLLTQNVYQTCFLDLDLPQISGIELATRVRAALGLNQHTTIVAMTAFRRKVPPGVFSDVLVKPVEGLRVKWALDHRSRASRSEAAAERASPTTGP